MHVSLQDKTNKAYLFVTLDSDWHESEKETQRSFQSNEKQSTKFSSFLHYRLMYLTDLLVLQLKWLITIHVSLQDKTNKANLFVRLDYDWHASEKETKKIFFVKWKRKCKILKHLFLKAHASDWLANTTTDHSFQWCKFPFRKS